MILSDIREVCKGVLAYSKKNTRSKVYLLLIYFIRKALSGANCEFYFDDYRFPLELSFIY